MFDFWFNSLSKLNKNEKQAIIEAKKGNFYTSINIINNTEDFNINITDDDDWSMIMYAIKYKNLDAFKFFFSNPKINLNIPILQEKLKFGLTAYYKNRNLLHFACEQGDVNIVEYIINSKKISIWDNQHTTISEYYLDGPLVSWDCYRTLLCIAVLNYRTDVVSFLLTIKDIDPNLGEKKDGYWNLSISRPPFLISPLYIACKNCCVDIANKLIQHNDIQLETGSTDVEDLPHSTPITIAYYHQHQPIIDLLCKKQPSLSVQLNQVNSECLIL